MAATSPTAAPGLPLHFLPYIDMGTLSQSELRNLSLCSSSSPAPPSRTIPSVDPTTFNESAGSRRQTYSRPSSLHHPHHHRHPLPKPHNHPTTTTTITTTENHSIITYLKGLLSAHPLFQDSNFTDLEILTNHIAFPSLEKVVSMPNVDSLEPGIEGLERKRKRGRKPKKVNLLSVEDRERAVGLKAVNKNGEVVDLVRLGNLEDPYKEELRKRTEGMGTDEELLGFFKELDGQWCSRRRKRRIVNASDFGDALPVGWKLLLGLKRKEGHTWVYCRRYISPGGQQFVSCKEVSAYLQSIFGHYDAKQAKGRPIDTIEQGHNRVASESKVAAIDRMEEQRKSYDHEKEIALLGIENLAEVQIRDLFECHKCRVTFEDKDTYLQHLLSFHQRTTRRYRVGSSVGDGVIVKDGKYECQFCHKVFNERRSYNGHVGIHVRNYVRGLEESPAAMMARQAGTDSVPKDEIPSRISKMDAFSVPKDEIPSRISKMDALIEIAQNSIHETTCSVPYKESSGGFTSEKQNMVSKTEVPSAVSYGHLFDSPPSQQAMKDEVMDKDKCLHPESSSKGNQEAMIKKISTASYVMASSANSQCGIACESTDEPDCDVYSVGSDGSEYLRSDELDKIMDVEIEMGFGSDSRGAINDIARETVAQSHHFKPADAVLDKGGEELAVGNQRHDKVTGFEELRLEDIEQLKYGFGAVEEPLMLHDVPLDLGSHTEIGKVYDAPVQLESEIEAANRQHHTTMCVWCGIEFNYEAADGEIQTDSVGYMCPACKAKISGQLNVLDDSCS